jgi:hypothetical protein
MAGERTFTVSLPRHLIEMLGYGPPYTYSGHKEGVVPIGTDAELAAALVALLERHHDQTYGEAARRAWAFENDHTDDPERGIGGSFYWPSDKDR